jgi:hypothetical protein
MALIDPPFDSILAETLKALHGYRDEIVLVGGCASALYRHVPAARSAAGAPLLTYDIDFAVAASLPRRGEPLSALLLRSGFAPSGDGRPTNKYRFAGGGGEIEFLCPMMGLPRKVKEQYPALVDLPAEVTAEALEYLDLLLLEPLPVNLRGVLPLADGEELAVRIPNPVSYVMQKVLIRSRRAGGERRKKDSYYIYEAALLFRAPGCLEAWARGLVGRFPAKWGRDFASQAALLYGHENAEGIQEAVEIAQANGVRVDAAMVFRTLAPRLAEIQNGLGLKSNKSGSTAG